MGRTTRAARRFVGARANPTQSRFEILQSLARVLIKHVRAFSARTASCRQPAHHCSRVQRRSVVRCVRVYVATTTNTPLAAVTPSSTFLALYTRR